MAQANDSTEKLTNNIELFTVAKPVIAYKLGTVLMVDMGSLYDLPKSVGSTVITKDGSRLVRTQEEPDGALYKQDWHLIVRPLIKPATSGVPIDAYAVSADDLANIRGDELTDDLSNYLIDREPEAYHRIRPLLDDLYQARLKCKAFWSRAEKRQVVPVTEQLLADPHLRNLGLSDGVALRVHNEWGEDCFAVPGDVVVVTDATSGTGYRVEAAAFEDSYQLA